MSERISAIIYYDGEVHDTKSDIFLSENTTRMVFNQSIDFTELHKRIKCKIFGTTPSRVSSIKYRFCVSIDPVTYDSFDIKGRYETSTRRNDVLLMTSTGEGTSYVADYGGLDDESDMDPPRELSPDGVEVVLFSKLEPILSEPEDVEEGSDEEEYPRFRAYSPLAHMHNVSISTDEVLEFPDVPHRMHDYTCSSLDLGELEVGKEFHNKDSLLGVSQDHPKLDSGMIASLILSMLKADPRTFVSCIIASIHNQLRYMPSYHKAWIAKQKALEKMHSG
ncbi:hypothetical protein J1N35_001103 [Gossypium stocksii]|uniref:Transposase MuDR plant domain-containing protein n=1 Tax=Gossypium stocksii TaxID=47602 RepID=A0A9D3WJ37_9ROSI|nr:hypothetical protein J1N35_001103 [Gossypium stocksii]